MSAASAILAGRAAAEALMVDECAVTREEPGGWNEAAGDYDPPTTTTVYLGRCKVQTRNVAVGEADAGEQEIAVVDWRVDLPVVGSEFVARGDTVTITVATNDAALLGMEFTVQGPHVGTAKTARRLPVKAVL